MSEIGTIDRDKLVSQLDRLLDWIKSCDTKSSIVLTAVGIFLTIFTSQNSLQMLNDIFTKSINDIDFSNVLYLLFFFTLSCIFIYGAYCLIRVLIPRLSAEAEANNGVYTDSLYFFESIANNTFSDYKEKVLFRQEEDELNDILSQILINAKICTIKFSYYSRGIRYTFIGISGVLALYIIGIILIKAGGL